METFQKTEPGEERYPAGADARGSPDDTTSLQEIAGKFWTLKWLIAGCAGICGLAALVVGKQMTPVYSAEALVLIKPVRAIETAHDASLRASIQLGPEAVPTEAIVLQSRTLARQTIERLHLDRDPEFSPRRPGDANNVPPAKGDPAVPVPGDGSPDGSTLGAAVVNGFLGRLQVAVEPRSNVIRVSFKSTNPTTAALVPNTLVQLYLDLLTSEKNRAVAQESARLDSVILPMLRQKMFDSEADRKIYEQYLARSDEAHGSMGQARPDASLLSAADVPLAPSFPRTRLMVMLGAGVGGGIGIVLVVLIDLLHGGLRTASQVENALGIRCLGAVPMLSPVERDRRQAALLQPRNTAFGQAISAIQLKLRIADRRPGSRVILVTSALPNEGKTWTAVSLAASLAADGVGVAIIDCDFHRPKVHQSLDGVRRPGLTDYFAGTASLADICHEAGNSGVKYVPVGGSAASEPGRMRPDLLLTVIDRLAEDCAFVILDSAPVLAISETMLLARAADTTILVVRWRATRAAVARHALRQLQESDARACAVLTIVDVKEAARHGDAVAGVYDRLADYYRPSPPVDNLQTARARLQRGIRAVADHIRGE